MTLVGSAMIASRVSIPVSILRLQTLQPMVTTSVIPTSDCRLNINNTACFTNEPSIINDLNIYSSTLSVLDTIDSLEMNDSYYDLIGKYDRSTPTFDNDYNKDSDYYRSSTLDMMKMLMVAMETEKISSKTSLIDYFINKHDSVSDSFDSVVKSNTGGDESSRRQHIGRFNNMFSISSASSSPVNLPAIDVSL